MSVEDLEVMQFTIRHLKMLENFLFQNVFKRDIRVKKDSNFIS